MTWFQITEIIYHHRDDQGRIVWGEKPIVTAEEAFANRWRKWGLSDDEITHKWEEFLTIEGYKHSLEQRGLKVDDVNRLAAEFERGIVAKRKWGR